MPRSTRPLTPLELRIMQVLWDKGPGTVQEVLHHLGSDHAHTTIHTMLNVLVRKGRVKRDKEGRAHRYRPAVARSVVVRQGLRDVVDRLFGGSPAKLMMNLMEQSELTPEEVAELRRRLQEVSRGDR